MQLQQLQRALDPAAQRGNSPVRLPTLADRLAARFWDIDDPRTALLVNAIVGGTPVYRHEFVQDDTPDGPEDFDDWVVRAALNPARPLFREARYLLAEEPDLRDPALYHSVLAAIAENSTSRGAIANYLGRQPSDLNHPLRVLEDVGMVVREQDAFAPGCPRRNVPARPVQRGRFHRRPAPDQRRGLRRAPRRPGPPLHRLTVVGAAALQSPPQVSTEGSTLRFRGMATYAPLRSGDFDLTADELRAVARYVVQHAEDVLPVFERAVPDDLRPRAAIEAARLFVDGAARTAVQRVAAVDAHRAARSAPTEAARLAARCAGDAASAAYLHPIAKATQVGHILRAAATAARIGEIEAGDDPAIGDALLERSRRRATPVLVDVLRRYPDVTGGSSRVARLTVTLDQALRRPARQQPGERPS